jgi:hypothetical protein
MDIAINSIHHEVFRIRHKTWLEDAMSLLGSVDCRYEGLK